MTSKKLSRLDAGRRAQTDAGPSRRAIVGGFGVSLFAPAVRAQSQLTDLTIAISSTSFATASVRAADILGCYARNGLNVKFPIMETGANLTAALVSGAVQVILGGSGEQVAAWVRGQQIVTLTNVYWGMAASIVLAKDVAERTGISPSASTRERFKALDGLLIAGPSATSTYTNAFKGAAEAAGAKIRFTYMAQPAMVAALESGVIQGYAAGAPFWGSQVARGKAVMWLSGPKGDVPPENTPASITAFQAIRAVADANPGLMRQVIASYRDFSDILEKTPEKVRAALGKIYPDVETDTLDLLFTAENGAWKMRPVTADSMKQEIAFMRASGASLPGIENLNPAAMFFAAK